MGAWKLLMCVNLKISKIYYFALLTEKSMRHTSLKSCWNQLTG